MKHTSKKWPAYSQYAALAAMYIATPAQGQVAYVDIDPDIILETGDIFTFDMNDDGQAEVQFRPGPVPSYSSTFGTFNLKAVPIFDGTADGYSAGLLGSVFTEPLYNLQFGMPNRLAEGDLIGAARSFFSYMNVDNSSWEPLGFMGIVPAIAGIENTWLPDGNSYYLGVRAMNWGEYYYGWLRVTVDSNYRKVIFHDYAYEVTPGQSILAGQLSPPVDIQNPSDDTWKLLANPISDAIRLQAPQTAVADAYLVLCDAGGRKLLTQNISASPGEWIELETGQIAAGMYILGIFSANAPTLQWTVVVK